MIGKPKRSMQVDSEAHPRLLWTQLYLNSANLPSPLAPSSVTLSTSAALAPSPLPAASTFSLSSLTCSGSSSSTSESSSASCFSMTEADAAPDWK
jgi:hypothetical protein